MPNKWEQLEAVAPGEQREQLAEMLLDRLAHGWGEVVIDVSDHHIKEFRDTKKLPAKRPRSGNGVQERKGDRAY